MIESFRPANPEHWMKRAACRNHPQPDMWFPDRDSHHKTAAIAICKTCPVANNCFQFAKRECIDFGIWGGTTPEQRRGWTIRVPAAAINHGTAGGYATEIRRKLQPCDECRRAHNEYRRNYEARRRTA
jgi:WhiB family transcriptional regulator, redox-sensing transcriptional regulator